MKKQLFPILLTLCVVVSAQQIDIPRIQLMPDKPSPYVMRDWKKVARDYDQLVFDTTRTGSYLPLTNINSSPGINYSDVRHIRMDTYVGQKNHGRVAEAINIIPAIVGASLVGIDKTKHFQTDWVIKVKDFFNRNNGQNVYLNGYSSSTGHDWWYELMPNVFFYQLYDLYPNADPDFAEHFITIADRQLEVLFKLGARLYPWTAPSMNYRAFNLLTGQPNSSSVPEPESAGSIAWILYQAYVATNEKKYLQGAELALDFLNNWTQNPSYEIQLPYGIVAAARMNAVEGTNYNIDKMMNWTFSSGAGTLRRWGTIIGKWNGYDVAGLIGEANDAGNDYAFVMNGFQHAAALAPVAKYDKRYARAIGKWILNLANASRLFYANGLPDVHQHPAGNSWAKQFDADFSIPFEALKQTANSRSPYAMGDAVPGGWASTDLSLYSGSSVGYLASIISTTNVEGILQIDLNKTDFRGENAYPTYLYYNPEATVQSVQIALSEGTYELYDAVSGLVLHSAVSGTVSFDVNALSARVVVVLPAGKSKQTVGRIRKVYEGGVIDYHYNYSYVNPLRIKAFTSDVTRAVSPQDVTFYCLAENTVGPTVYKWFINGAHVSGAGGATLVWKVPSVSGVYRVRCEVTANYRTVVSEEIAVAVAPEGEVVPQIHGLTVAGALSSLYPTSGEVQVVAEISPATAGFTWSVSGGTLLEAHKLTPVWYLPASPGLYSITLKVSNMLGEVVEKREVLVKDLHRENVDEEILVYYPMNGDVRNAAQDAYHAVINGAQSANDQRGFSNHAFAFTNNSQYILTPNHEALNFTDRLAVSLWVKPDQLPDFEQFVISHGSYEERYKLSVTPDRKVRWTLKTTQGIVDVDDPTPLKAGEFVHYTGQYTGYSLELYRNGRMVDYKPLTGAIGVSSKSITLARKDEVETNYYFRGTVDEVRIYNAELPIRYIEKIPSMWDLVSGVGSVYEPKVFGVYPNPFGESFRLILPVEIEQSLMATHFSSSDEVETRTLSLYDMQGRRVYMQSGVRNSIEVSPGVGLMPGVYLLVFSTSLGDVMRVPVVRKVW